jgi:hypothetical protein
MEADMFVYALLFWIAPVFVGALIGAGRGRTAAGFFLPLFFSWIGVIITALLPLTPEKVAERDGQLAVAIGRELGATSGQPARPVDDEELRRWATAEAVQRDPTLLDATTPEELGRLRQMTEAILVERQTADDLKAVREENEARQQEQEARRRQVAEDRERGSLGGGPVGGE